MNISNTLERLRATNSSNEKLEILKETKSDVLAKIFKAAHDPFITYGISKVDADDLEYDNYSLFSPEDWIEDLHDLLDLLAKRERTGNAARDEILDLMSDATKEDASIVPLILKRDLRIGAGAKLINKVYPALLPEDFCMSANKYDKKRVKFPVYADTKLDGVRCIAVVESDGVRLFSRNGKEFKNYTTIAQEISTLNLAEGTRLDGEVTMGHFQDLMKTVSSKTEGIELAKDAIYNIFDIPNPTDDFEMRVLDLELLNIQIKENGLKHVKIITGKKIETEEDLHAFYEEQLASGEEGCMVKTFDGKYEFRRGWGWQKMKPEHTEDLEIVGCEEGNGKYEGQLGVFVCRLENGGDVRVGSGLKDEEREMLWNRREELIGQFIEIKFQEKTRDGSLRFPIFIKFRPDKS